jgi:hypothetical protein
MASPPPVCDPPHGPNRHARRSKLARFLAPATDLARRRSYATPPGPRELPLPVADPAKLAVCPARGADLTGPCASPRARGRPVRPAAAVVLPNESLDSNEALTYSGEFKNGGREWQPKG